MSKENSNFIIPFKDLKEGKHSFKFFIAENFFQLSELTDIKNGNLDVLLNLNKTELISTLVIKVNGIIQLECDRCLELFDYSLKFENEFLIKISDSFDENSDIQNLILVKETDITIDLRQYIYEYIYLNLPYKRHHEDDEYGNPTCNLDMLNRLDNLKTKKTDARWDNLKQLLQ